VHPYKYLNPVLVNPPFRNELVAAFSQHAGEQEVVVLDRLLPLLDGAHTLGEIYGRLVPEDISPSVISKALDALDKLGLLADLSPAAGGMLGKEETERYGSQLACLEEWLKVRQDREESRTNALRAQSSLQQSRTAIMGLGRIGRSLIEALAGAGVGQIFGLRAGGSGTTEAQAASQLLSRVHELNPLVKYVEINSVENEVLGRAEPNGDYPLLVYCPDEFREEVCEQLNTLALSMGASLLVYRETSFSVELGPLIVPRQTACYVCYKLRRKAAEPERERELDEAPPANAPALNFSSGAHLLALEIVKILTRAAFPVTRGKLWRLGLFDGAVTVHPVLKLPRCPACGVQRITPPRRIWEE
jgi:bacteriocin biosynthesis cyclodehydratase domain-containing protein